MYLYPLEGWIAHFSSGPYRKKTIRSQRIPVFYGRRKPGAFRMKFILSAFLFYAGKYEDQVTIKTKGGASRSSWKGGNGSTGQAPQGEGTNGAALRKRFPSAFFVL